MASITRSKMVERAAFLQTHLTPFIVFCCLTLATGVFLVTPVLFYNSQKAIRLSPVDQLGFFVVPYLTGLIYLLSGWYVFGLRQRDPAGRAFAVFTAAAAVALAGLFDLYTARRLTGLLAFSLAVSGGALISLAALFPQRLSRIAQYPLLGWLGYAAGIALGVGAGLSVSNPANPGGSISLWRLELVFVSFSAAVLGVLALYRWRRAASPVAREQARLLFWGLLLSVAPLGLWLVLAAFKPGALLTPFPLISLVFFPIFASYAIIRYRLLQADYLLSRVVLYGLLVGLAMAGYGLLVTGLSLLARDVFDLTNPLLTGLVIFVLVLCLSPLRAWLQGLIERYFFRGQVIQRATQQEFGQELTQVLDLDEMVALLRRTVDKAFSPAQLHIFLYEPFAAQYQAMPGENGLRTSDIRFPASSALVHVLGKKKEALFLAGLAEAAQAGAGLAASVSAGLPAPLQSDQARLSLLAATLYVPMPGRNRLVGWLGLGSRRSGEPYTDRDLRFLEGLGNQAALAVERAQVLADLERRVHEMNVLTRVAQGVSFTVVFDDILEMISAQTNQILPARDFRITLLDPETDLISHVFFLEDDERLVEREGRALPTGLGLEGEVIASRRAIISDDYLRECRRRGLMADAKDVYAWMGVPLNAGADVIGAISIASRDPAVLYTDEQRNLLQAIADQASGAIVKARSLDESERRARQLAKLNEISLGLTATLDLKPLLNLIMGSALEILNCQAGSLLLVDQQTGELVFEVALGPVAASLLGQRLPPEAGIAGQAVHSGKPVIANDAKRRQEWFEKTDQQTGFETQDILAVPMRMQERVIGVLEVINKKDGAPFTLSDQGYLTAFTSQATIAIENARLYTLTDQALAARVEELSVMQRIDRELNASLDIERAMRLTLEWALRQSGADAGLVGRVEAGGLRVMAAQGYEQELAGRLLGENGASAPAQGPAVERSALQQAFEGGQTACLKLEAGQNGGLLEDVRLQILVPIRRETITIGLMLLESRREDDLPDETLTFLTRLSDHAAIAIANAQLYEEVTDANLAKSRFVSFVAHELKNPMSSIKGYTELVASGMAGPVNEMQSNFLGTVRSNVDRMNTIVSDLNDLTKIQVGNLRLEYRAVHILEVLEEVTRSLKRQIEDKKQKVTLELAEDLPAVWADPARLAQILTNLVSNAQKYTPEGGSFTIGAERHLEAGGVLAGTAFVHTWVQDQGIGISEADQVHIFQQYFRTDDAKEMASGTGLGLAITRSLVEMQGGRIWFESQQGNGATFHFTIPVAEME